MVPRMQNFTIWSGKSRMSFNFLLNGVLNIAVMLKVFAYNITYISLSRLQIIDIRIRKQKW